MDFIHETEVRILYGTPRQGVDRALDRESGRALYASRG
jgi:hypothetical protein